MDFLSTWTVENVLSSILPSIQYYLNENRLGMSGGENQRFYNRGGFLAFRLLLLAQAEAEAEAEADSFLLSSFFFFLLLFFLSVLFTDR